MQKQVARATKQKKGIRFSHPTASTVSINKKGASFFFPVILGNQM